MPMWHEYLKLPQPEDYDKLGRMTTVRDREEQNTSRKYDREGNLESITDAKQVETKYTYDPAGRKIETEYDAAGVNSPPARVPL